MDSMTRSPTLEDQLHESEELSWRLFESSPERIELVDRAGRLLRMNASGLQALELDDFAALRGRLWEDLWAESSRGVAHDALEAVRTGKDASFEGAGSMPQGTTAKSWSVTISGLRNRAGEVTRFLVVARDISPRTRTDQALRESEERFRNLAEAMPHLVWQLAADGHLIYANQHWFSYFGRSQLGLLEWSEAVHPDDLGRMWAEWDDMLRGEWQIEPIRLRRHDGTFRWFSCRSVPVHDANGRLLHLVGTSTDVEELKRTQDALHVSRARLATALQAAGMGTWVWQIAGDHMQMDESLAQLLGFGAAEAEHATMVDFIARVHPEDRATLRGALARAETGEFEVEFRLPQADRRNIWLAAKGRIERGAHGRARQLFGACVDITQHKRLEEELRQAQKMEAIGRLAGGVAHDFNNLLTVILGQASVLGLRHELPADVAAAIGEIAGAAERAASLTTQLLAFGRRQLLQTRDLNLEHVVASVVQMLQRLLGENVALRIETVSPPPCVHADPNMLTQVLLNLALNARDSMPRGGRVTIRTSCETIDEQSAQAMPEARAGTWACLAVSDTGAGIPPEILPRIFEPFFTTKEVGKGTGLGLPTVYGIVKQHHGWMSVDSAPGRGTTFKAFLPLLAAEALPLAPPPAQQIARGNGELILLVEDESSVRSVAQNILGQHGFRLMVAADGRQALEAFAKHGAHIDLLLTDVVMPHGVSGTELAAQLQAQKPGLPIILCSGYSAEHAGQDARTLVHSMFLQKPYRCEQLLSLVRLMLDDRGSGGTPCG
jgi:PAS domain S-box-containing protein